MSSSARPPRVHIKYAATDADVRRAYGLTKADVTNLLQQLAATAAGSRKSPPKPGPAKPAPAKKARKKVAVTS